MNRRAVEQADAATATIVPSALTATAAMPAQRMKWSANGSARVGMFAVQPQTFGSNRNAVPETFFTFLEIAFRRERRPNAIRRARRRAP